MKVHDIRLTEKWVRKIILVILLSPPILIEPPVFSNVLDCPK